MITNYSAETDDTLVEEVAASAPNGEVTLRLQPTIRRQGNYVGWAGVSWTLTCEGAAEAIALRDALREFFAAVGRRDPATVRKVLQGI